MKKKMIVAVLVVLLLTFSSVIAAANTVTNDPPYEPSDPNPEDEAIDVCINTHLSWTGGDPDPGDKAVYDVYFGTEQIPPLITSDLQNPNYTPDKLEFETQYHWKVVAEDEHGATVEGPLWTFTTKQCDNDPPNKPEKPSGPTRARHRHTYSYSTRTMDPNGDGLYYNFSWGDGNCSGWLGPYENHKRAWADYEWCKPGTYQVRVKAMDGPRNETMTLYMDGDESPWSDPLTVTVTTEDPPNESPNTPSIEGATSGKAGVEYDYTFAATDPDMDDITYVVNWGCCSDEEYTYGPYPSGYQLTIGHSWAQQGAYTIKVKAKDVYDGESDWATLEVSMPKNKQLMPLDKTLPNGNQLWLRIRNRICDMLGICIGGCVLEEVTGILTYDGTYFYVDDIEVHFGPYRYITSAVAAYDYDRDGTEEVIFEELQGLVGTTVTVEGHFQSDNWLCVFTINGETYRDIGKPIWSGGHNNGRGHGHGGNGNGGGGHEL